MMFLKLSVNPSSKSMEIGSWIFLLALFASCNGQLELRAEYLEVKLPTPTCVTAFYEEEDSIYLGGKCSNTDSRLLKFSVSSETMEVVGSLPGPTDFGTAEGDESGNIFFFSGGEDYKDVYKYDPTSNNSSMVTQLPWEYHYGYSSIKFNATTVLFIGGNEEYNFGTFDLNALTSSRVGSTAINLFGPTAINVGEGKAFVFANTKFAGWQQVLQLDLATLEMTKVGPSLYPAFNFATSVWDGRFIYIFGGYQNMYGHRTDGIFQFDPITLQSTLIPLTNMKPFSFYEVAPASVYVPSRNRIYFFGGIASDGDFATYRDEIWFIDLASVPPPTTTTTTTDTPTTTLRPDLFNCVNRTNGMYPHPTDCAKFIGCHEEEMEIFSCPPPLLFDPVAKNCNLPHMVNCDLSCADRPDGRYPHPGDCSLFIICVDGGTNVFRCPAPLLFNPQTSTCDFPSEVTCDL